MKKMKSFLFGSMLGAGLVWMTTTPKGKKFRDEALKHGKAVAEEAAKMLQKDGVVRNTVTEVEGALQSAYDAYIKDTQLEEGLCKAVKRVSTVSLHNTVRKTQKK